MDPQGPSLCGGFQTYSVSREKGLAGVTDMTVKASVEGDMAYMALQSKTPSKKQT